VVLLDPLPEHYAEKAPIEDSAESIEAEQT